MLPYHDTDRTYDLRRMNCIFGNILYIDLRKLSKNVSVLKGLPGNPVSLEDLIKKFVGSVALFGKRGYR